jgi:site-specific recombinase XerD
VHITFKRFESELARQGKSAATQRGYLSDLRDFAAWVEQTYGEPFDPRRLVREDVRAYRSRLLTVRHQKPATINRKQAPFRRIRFLRTSPLRCPEIISDNRVYLIPKYHTRFLAMTAV